MVQGRNIKSPNDADIYVGAKLRVMRQHRGMSQRDLASLVNVTFQQIQKYEKGINRMSIGTLYDICRALEISPVQFLKTCYQAENKLAEPNVTEVVREIMDHLSKLTLENQQKVLDFIKTLKQ